jgi:uncharacterized repeat protein (TIGR01451 family)
MNRKRKDARGTRGRSRMPRHAFAVVFGVVAILTIVSVSGACPPPRVLGPPGYDAGNDVLVVAGTETPTLVSGDHVVICHAIGMTNHDGYQQIAPAAEGVKSGHAGAGHQAGEDIIPPFIYSNGSSLDDSLVNGQNWTTAGRIVYENGCQTPGTLTVVKQVVGGSAVPADFLMHVDAVGTADDSSFAGSAHGVTLTLPVGAYTVTESGGPPHYTASSTHCSGTIVANQSVTCTITNTYDVPSTGSLTVVKQVVPAHANKDFPFTVTPVASASSEVLGLLLGDSFVLNAGTSETASHTSVVPAGWYTVTEGAVAGWKLSSVSCTGDDGVREVGPADVHVRAGDEVQCVFTNERLPVPASLTVVKQVVGGTAAPGDFTMDVDASGTTADTSFAGTATGTTVSVPAGAYSVGEHGGPAHYLASKSAGCEGTLTEGASVTCTITNTYQPPEAPVTTTTTVVATTPVVPTAVDLVVTKVGTPDPVAVGGLLTYTITVTNKPPLEGPSFTATDVTLVDPLPSGVVYVAASPSQGTCTVETNGLVCKLGSLEPAATAAVVVTVRPGSAGTLTNTVVAVAAEPEQNAADNSATEVTTVRGPFAPPALRCTAITVRPISLQVGQKRIVIVRVSDQRGKPLAGALVTVRGPGVNVHGTTSNTGIYRHVFHPKKPGVLVVRALPGASGKCLGRIGVVGVFQPPVTG